jgi:hypothetical protein
MCERLQHVAGRAQRSFACQGAQSKTLTRGPTILTARPCASAVRGVATPAVRLCPQSQRASLCEDAGLAPSHVRPRWHHRDSTTKGAWMRQARYDVNLFVAILCTTSLIVIVSIPVLRIQVWAASHLVTQRCQRLQRCSVHLQAVVHGHLGSWGAERRR